MTLEGTWDDTANSYNDCWGYTDKNGNEYAIIGSRTKIHFLDISTPTNPVYLQGFSGASNGISGANSTWRDIKTYENYAYSVADVGAEGLMIFDLTDLPTGSISKVYQKNSDFGKAHNIFIDVPQAKLYVIGSNTQNAGLIVYDLADDPSNPPKIASVNVSGGYLHDAFVYNDTVYGSSGNEGFYMIDMTTPTAPSLIGNNKTPIAGYNHSGWFYDNGDKYIIAEEIPQGVDLTVFDISNPSNPTFIDQFSHPINSGTNVTYHNPFMIGDYAIISSYQDGVTIMDVADPSNTSLEAYYDTYSGSGTGYAGCWGTYPFFPSETIIGSDISTGLYVLSTSLTLENTCNNGIKDGFEQDIDCGGFCAACECEAPNDAIASNLSTTLSQISWSSVVSASGYELSYRISGTTTWTTISQSTTTFNLTTDGSSVYEFQVRTDCGGRMTGFHPIQSFQSGGGCLAYQNYTGTQPAGSYNAQIKITSISQILPTNLVRYSAGDTICLDTNFTVSTNTNFIAEIGGCSPMVYQAEAPTSYVNDTSEVSIGNHLGVDLFSFTEQGESGIIHLEIYYPMEMDEELVICNSDNEEIITLETTNYKKGWNWVKLNQNDLSKDVSKLSIKAK